MKKFLITAMIFASLVSFVSCGSKSSTAETTNTKVDQTEEGNADEHENPNLACRAGTARSSCVGSSGPPAAGVYPIRLARGIDGEGSGSGRGGCDGRVNGLLSAGPVPAGCG